MEILILFLSSIVCMAAVAPVARRPVTWFQKLFRRFAPVHASAVPEIIGQEAGWTLLPCDDPDAFLEWLGRDEVSFPLRDGEETSLGSHLLVEMFGCDPETLRQQASVARAMHDAADVSRATIVAESFHEFKPYGVSGAVIIQESHYTIHTWPEHAYAAVDLFYCGGTIHVHQAVKLLNERFRPKRMKFLIVRRGVRSEVYR